jgi:hypothetical protein
MWIFVNETQLNVMFYSIKQKIEKKVCFNFFEKF